MSKEEKEAEEAKKRERREEEEEMKRRGREAERREWREVQEVAKEAAKQEWKAEVERRSRGKQWRMAEFGGREEGRVAGRIAGWSKSGGCGAEQTRRPTNSAHPKLTRWCVRTTR